jgi:hypothetical protein
MRVVSVPGRTVRHPVTLRVITERGIPYDPFDFAIAQLINHGDLKLVEDEPEDVPAGSNAGAQADAGMPVSTSLEPSENPVTPVGADAPEQE